MLNQTSYCAQTLQSSFSVPEYLAKNLFFRSPIETLTSATLNQILHNECLMMCLSLLPWLYSSRSNKSCESLGLVSAYYDTDKTPLQSCNTFILTCNSSDWDIYYSTNHDSTQSSCPRFAFHSQMCNRLQRSWCNNEIYLHRMHCILFHILKGEVLLVRVSKVSFC